MPTAAPRRGRELLAARVRECAHVAHPPWPREPRPRHDRHERVVRLENEDRCERIHQNVLGAVGEGDEEEKRAAEHEEHAHAQHVKDVPGNPPHQACAICARYFHISHEDGVSNDEVTDLAEDRVGEHAVAEEHGGECGDRHLGDVFVVHVEPLVRVIRAARVEHPGRVVIVARERGLADAVRQPPAREALHEEHGEREQHAEDHDDELAAAGPLAALRLVREAHDQRPVERLVHRLVPRVGRERHLRVGLGLV